ncbi:MAG: ribbon-helix-helix domain-containing protein [Hyphomicrobiales bacterium]|jgi:predicted DNA-binding ribbon-helix-helix protein|nr:ribbon-helix-helix domain-containing protein [Hyphomicrobiales bacterium]NBS02126.1 aryl-sulfate sulfotransferase [Hyphomicrobiales bacterium]
MSGISKRSIVIAGHSTSVSLEPEFWDGLKAMSVKRGISLAALVADLDSQRSSANLSSALRLAVLSFYRDRPTPSDPA